MSRVEGEGRQLTLQQPAYARGFDDWKADNEGWLNRGQCSDMKDMHWHCGNVV